MINPVIVNELGFDGGGVAKLGIEFSKLGLPTLFKNVIQPLQYKAEDLGKIVLYENFNDIEDIVLKQQYNRIIFLQFTINKNDLEKKILAIKNLKARLVNVDFCFIYCARKLNYWNEMYTILCNHHFQFDYYFSITKKLSDVLNNCKYININAYTFPKRTVNVQYEEKQKVVFTAGRVESVKGILSYFQCCDSLIDGKYLYIHEGAKFNFNKTGNVSVTPQLLSLFDVRCSPKKVIFPFEFKDYSELPDKNRLTIYPSYPMSSRLNKWSNYLVGVCCILGTKSKCVNKSTLFGNNWIAIDTKEEKRISNIQEYWSDALEYVTIEMISYGIPVLFSRKYATLLKFTDERLIYDSFKDINKKVIEIDNKDVYDEVRYNQFMFFYNKQDEINNNLLREFYRII